ncbi:MAG: hypothetical protein IPG81_10185 [Sandaracinaceae bacterium]|nr:hypothetical protein [Sandaracinaceae bacterium]
MKTDRRDARCLAEACQLGAYRAAHRTSDASRHLRDLVLTRKLQVRMRSQTIVTLRSLLRREGFRLRSGAVSSFRTLHATMDDTSASRPPVPFARTWAWFLRAQQRWERGSLATSPSAVSPVLRKPARRGRVAHRA